MLLCTQAAGPQCGACVGSVWTRGGTSCGGGVHEVWRPQPVPATACARVYAIQPPPYPEV